MYSQLQLTRTEAVKSGRSLFVTYTSGANWCAGIREGGTCDCTLPLTSTTAADLATTEECAILGDGSTPVLKVIQSADFPGTSLSETMTTDALAFDSVRGTLSGTDLSGSVTLTSTKTAQTLRVQTNALGNSSICAPSSSDPGGYPAC